MNDASFLRTIKSSGAQSDRDVALVAPPIPFPDNTGDEALAWLLQNLPSKTARAFSEQPGLPSFLFTVSENSPYLARQIVEFPDVVDQCHQGGFENTFQSLCSQAEADLKAENSRDVLMRELRLFKRKATLIAGLADLGGWWDATRVGEAISDVADLALQLAICHLLRDLHASGKLNLPDRDDPCRGSGFSVIAMGKHGARELNYSSDIDLVVIFDPEVPALIDPDESVKLFVRMTRELVRIMQERTADGYVFRTDLRLRPDPSAMPLAIPLPLALTYYEARGQNWERAAMIKARPVAGDLETGHQFLDELIPFIWRRYLDYAAIADIHSIKRQLQSHRGYDSIEVSGHNVKLGLGGIREIEFFVQTQQLIAGGRIPRLRGRRTLGVMDLLREEGWISDHVCQDLKESYSFLRDVEHRLQMIDDDQTHTIPEATDPQQQVALLSGTEDFDDFAAMVEAHLKRVHAHYSDLFSTEADLAVDAGTLSFTGEGNDPGTLKTLAEMGFSDPARVTKTVQGWHYGRFPAMQSTEAREMLTELTPQLLASIAANADSDQTLALFDEFVRGLPAGIQLFSVLNRNRGLLGLLLDILASAPRLANLIRRRPHIFDAFLELGSQSELPSSQELHDRLARTLMQARSDEDSFDRARIFVAEHRFLIGLYVFSGSLDIKKAGQEYTKLAECMIDQLFDRVRAAFEVQHGRLSHSSIALVGLGNLGDRELTATSDLDLLVLYEFDPDHDTSDGRKPLHASQYFGRLTQRFISAMSAPTAQGIVYELDMRLRPYGADGPVATSLRAFEKHYSDNAETWERLALTRARVLRSDRRFGDKVRNRIYAATTGLEPEKVTKDVLAMRTLMDKERPASDIWDTKLASGGLIDLEFIVQWGKLTDLIERDLSEVQALELFEPVSLQNDNMTLGAALLRFRSVVQFMRLCLEHHASEDWPEGFRNRMLKLIDAPDMKAAAAALRDMQKVIRATFMKLMKT